MNMRFTAWFSERERLALDTRARSERTSVNVLVREAVRQYLGIDETIELGEEIVDGELVAYGEAQRAPRKQLSHVTSEGLSEP